MRRVLEAILRREGYDVITAANGVEALSGMSRQRAHRDHRPQDAGAGRHGAAQEAVGRLPRRAGGDDHGARLGRERRRGGEAGGVRLPREAVRAGADPPDRQQGDEHLCARAARRHARGAGGSRALSPGRPVGRDPADLRRGREGRRHAVDGADHRRVGHRQGADRARAARELVAPHRAVHQDQLRRDPQDADGVGAVRLRQGGVHRRGRREAGTIRAGARRDAVPRRDRRDPDRHAGQAAARAAGVGVRARRRHQDHQGRRAAGGGHQPRSRAGGRRAAASARICTTG